MSRRDNEHDVLMKLGDNVDLMRRTMADYGSYGYSRDNPGNEGNIVVEFDDRVVERVSGKLDRIEGATRDSVSVSREIAETQAEALDSLHSIESNTAELPAIRQGIGEMVDGIESLDESLDDLYHEQAQTTAVLKVVSGHTAELPAIRAELGTLNKIAGGHLGVAVTGVITQVMQLSKLGDIESEIIDLHDDLVDVLEDVEIAVTKVGEQISRQIRVSAQATTQVLARRLDYQTAIVADRLTYLANISNVNRQAVVAAIDHLNTEAERRKKEVVEAIRDELENNAEAKFRDALMHMQIGRYGAAVRALRGVFQYKDTHAPAWLYFGICAEQLGRNTEARNAYYLASRYALMAKQVGRDSLAIKNNEIYDRSLARLVRLEQMFGNDGLALQMSVEAQADWKPSSELYRIRYERIRLNILSGDYDETTISQGAKILKKISKHIPDIRIEVSTEPMFESCRQAKKSLCYGKGPFVFLLEFFEKFDPLMCQVFGTDYAELDTDGYSPQIVSKGYELFLYRRLRNKVLTLLDGMSGDCSKRNKTSLGRKDYRCLRRFIVLFPKLIELYNTEYRLGYHTAYSLSYDPSESKKKSVATSFAIRAVLSELHTWLWRIDSTEHHLRILLGWEQIPYEDDKVHPQRQFYSPEIIEQLKKVKAVLTALGFSRRVPTVGNPLDTEELDLADLHVVDATFLYHLKLIPTAYTVCVEKDNELNRQYVQPVLPWWKPEVSRSIPVVVFYPFSRKEIEESNDPSCAVMPHAIPLYFDRKFHVDGTPAHGRELNEFREFDCSFSPKQITVIRGGQRVEERCWFGQIPGDPYVAKDVYLLGKEGPYKGVKKKGKVRVGLLFWSFGMYRSYLF